MKRRMVGLLCMAIMAPLLPLIALYYCCYGFMWLMECDASDWIFNHSFGFAIDRIERLFRIDPQSDYEAWQARMRARKEQAT